MAQGYEEVGETLSEPLSCWQLRVTCHNKEDSSHTAAVHMPSTDPSRCHPYLFPLTC